MGPDRSVDRSLDRSLDGSPAGDDVELMLALGRGELDAFDVLFNRWSGRLLRFVERMVSDVGTAEELVQETFLRVYRARETYAAESRFSTWLYRIATNLALNELRRPRRKRPHASADDDEAPIELVARGSGPDAIAHARLEVAALSRELERLPERQRLALWLTAVEGHSYAEVSEILDASEKSVKSLVHRGRSTLAARLPLTAEPSLESRSKESRSKESRSKEQGEEPWRMTRAWETGRRPAGAETTGTRRCRRSRTASCPPKRKPS